MAALSLIYIGIATRTLGITDFGRFALITGASQMLAALVSFETWKIVVQYGLEHEARGDSAAVWRVQKASALMEVASAVMGILVVIALFSLWPEPGNIKSDVRPYAIGYAVVQLLTLRSTPTGILRLRNKFGLSAMADSAQPIGRLIGALGALAFWPTVQGFLLGYAMAEIATWIAYWAVVARTADLRGLLGAKLNGRAVLDQNKGLLRFMWSTNLQASLGLASRQAPLLLVGGYAGPTAAGAFRLALQLANALSKVSTLVMRAAFPELVRSIRALPRERFLWFVGRILMSGIAGGAVVMLVVIIGGRALLVAVGGQEFSRAYVMLLWLAGAGCVELAATAFEPILLTVHRAGTTILARGAAVILQLLAMLALLPAMGALGASISIFLGAVLAALFLGIALARYAAGHGAVEMAA
jgi:O-antigen/teichoic acid export membrane protein